jgi:hypothetical protein
VAIEDSTASIAVESATTTSVSTAAA